MRVLESDIERKAVAMIMNRLSVVCVKLTTPGETGYPDRLVVLPNGRVLWMEFKRPGELPRPKQSYIHEQLRKLGHHVEVCDDAVKAFEIVEAALRKSVGALQRRGVKC